MPTSLPTLSRPISRFVEIRDQTEATVGASGIWLIAVWAISMLLFSALMTFGQPTAEPDALQLLGAF